MPEHLNLEPSVPDASSRRRRRLMGVIGVAVLLLGGLSLVPLLTWSDEQYRARCRELSDAEQWDQLQKVAADWVSAASMPDEAYIYLADAQLNSGQPLLAIENLLRVPPQSHRSFAALITACNLQFGPVNRPLDGVRTLELMIQQRPSSISSHQRLIFFYAVTLQRNRMLAAIYDAIRAGAEPPDAYGYLILADHLSFSNGFTKNSEWLKSDPEAEVFQAARIVQLIDQVKSSEDPAAGAALERYVESFEQLRQKYPENLVLLRSAIERAAENYDIEQVESLLNQVPAGTTDSVILRHQGWLKFQQDQFQDARRLLEQSLSEHALDWHAWHELAACHRRLGNLTEAEEASEIAITGKALRKELLQLEDAAAVSADLLARIGRYAESCGEQRVSAAIHRRLYAMGQVPN
ncbi:MAG: hypothetical protein RIK87_25660 [Fuerstiella sp.]